jgi:phosphoglycerate dehydrogenase-like enzyme
MCAAWARTGGQGPDGARARSSRRGRRAAQVGSEVARRGFGIGFAAVIAYDPFASEAKAAALGVRLVSFDEALAAGDFFSLHMPLTPDTKAR